jgi:hypothetical protein
MIINPNIIPSVINPNEPPSTQAPPTRALALLPDVDQLACSGDPGAMLAALATKTSKLESETARNQRNAAMRAQANAEQAAVQDIHDKASLQRIQGVVDGTLQMVQGGCDLGSGLNEAQQAHEQAQATAQQADLQQNGAKYGADHRQAVQQSINALNTGVGDSKVAAAWWRGGGAAAGATRSVTDGLFNGAISDKDADVKMHEASATTFKQFADDAHDYEKDAKDLLSRALDFYKEYVDTKAQTAMAALHRA